EVDHGTVTINDNDLMPTLTVTDVTVNEGNTGQQTTMVFKVELSNVDETGTWTLKRKTIDGIGDTGAISGGSKADFLALAEADLNFAPGEVSKNVTVTVYGDNRDEYDQTFSLDVR